MKQKLSILLLCTSLLQAAPNEELASDKKNVKKIQKNNRSQVLTDLTRITLGVGCCVASAVLARNSYDAYQACCDTTSPESIAHKAIKKIDYGKIAQSAWKSTKDTVWWMGNAIKKRYDQFGAFRDTLPRRFLNWRNGTPNDPVDNSIVTPPPALRRPESPRILNGSTVGIVASNDFYAHYLKSVGWGTGSLITGVVGLKLIAQGLHIGDLFATKNKEIDEEDSN
jgi:hypothetical protein